MKTGFTALNSSQLFDIEFLVRALVSSLWLAVLKLTLDKQGSGIECLLVLQSLTGSVENESVVPNLRIVLP